MPRRLAPARSGFSGLMAAENTTSEAPCTFSSFWPIITGMPAFCRRSVKLDSPRSDPVTVYPRLWSISARPCMLVPPMPIKWIRPFL